MEEERLEVRKLDKESWDSQGGEAVMNCLSGKEGEQ